MWILSLLAHLLNKTMASAIYPSLRLRPSFSSATSLSSSSSSGDIKPRPAVILPVINLIPLLWCVVPPFFVFFFTFLDQVLHFPYETSLKSKTLVLCYGFITLWGLHGVLYASYVEFLWLGFRKQFRRLQEAGGDIGWVRCSFSGCSCVKAWLV